MEKITPSIPNEVLDRYTPSERIEFQAHLETKRIYLTPQEKNQMLELIKTYLEDRDIEYSSKVVDSYLSSWQIEKFNLWQKFGYQIIVGLAVPPEEAQDSAWARELRFDQARATVSAHFPQGWVKGRLGGRRNRNWLVNGITPFFTNTPFHLTGPQNEYNQMITEWMEGLLLALAEDFEQWEDHEDAEKLVKLFDKDIVGYTMELWDLKRMAERILRFSSSDINIETALDYARELQELYFHIFPSKSPKLSKVLAQAKVYGPCTKELMEETILFISQLNNKIDTSTADFELKMSIHPMDFLTMSDNDSGWSSCTSLKNDGGYKGATLGWMVDSGTFITYAQSTKSVLNFGPYTWNNKRWRMLAHLSEPGFGVASGRQYPMEAPNLERSMLNWWKAQNPSWVDEMEPTAPARGIAFFDVVRSCAEDSVYCDGFRRVVGDFIEREKGTDDFSIAKIKRRLNFYLGGETLCLKCGTWLGIEDHDDGAAMWCNDCAREIYGEEEWD